MGEDEFAFGALLPGKHLPVCWIDQFGMKHIERHEMEVIVDFALSGESGEHIGDAVIGIPRLEAPDGFEPAAEFRIIEPALAAEQAEPQAEVARLHLRIMLGDDLLENLRIGRSAGNGGDAEFPQSFG